jgi:tetraacyldisaccharide 4'-kinase
MRKGLRTKVDAPVLCIGNFTVGGTGKTPTAIAFAERARALGLVPGILSRGHGGSRMQPTIVDAERDRADDVGDEPLLLAKHAVVAVGRDRQAAAEMLIGAAATSSSWMTDCRARISTWTMRSRSSMRVTAWATAM